MGGAVSAGRDNNELVSNLVQSHYIRTEIVEKVFRAVDRADYLLPDCRKQAYKDIAWRSGIYHLSAPCIYSDVMENLMLKPGLSFLNLGSGTGYLSTMVGLILGSNGINHGVDILPEIVVYARERLHHFISHSPAIDEFDFCEPSFMAGNCLSISPLPQQYDRVYCGASCPKIYESHVKRLIKVGGILVMPLEDKLVQIRRITDTVWLTKNIQCVSFAILSEPLPANLHMHFNLMPMVPPTLQSLCRSQIRNVLRNIAIKELPELPKPELKVGPWEKRVQSSQHIIIPLHSDDSDVDIDEFNAMHNLDERSGSREMNALLNLVLSMGSNRPGGVIDLNSDDVAEFILATNNANAPAQNQPSMDSSQTENIPSASTSSTSPPVAEEPSVFDYQTISQDDSNSACQCRIMERIECDKADKSTSTEEATSKETESTITNTPEVASSSSVKREKLDSGIGDEEVCTIAEQDSASTDYTESEHMDANSSEEYLADTGDSEQHKSPNKPDGARTRRTRRQRKRHLDEEDEDADVEEGDTSDEDSDTSTHSQSLRIKKLRRSPLPPNPNDTWRLKLSSALKSKVNMLPLPPPLKYFINFNREF